VALLVVTSTLAGAAFGGLTIPDPEPGVERTYDDTFRVLASNDPDPARGSSTVRLYEYDSGTIRDVNRTVATQPVQLWEDSIRPRDALVIANESDMYQSGLTGYYTIPYRDQWHTLEEWNTKWGQRELRILPLYDADPSRATDTDGEYTVEARNPNGWWDPVYGAEVELVGSDLEVTNPGSSSDTSGTPNSHPARPSPGVQPPSRWTTAVRCSRRSRGRRPRSCGAAGHTTSSETPTSASSTYSRASGTEAGTSRRTSR
jgi:hypothetical protein